MKQASLTQVIQDARKLSVGERILLAEFSIISVIDETRPYVGSLGRMHSMLIWPIIRINALMIRTMRRALLGREDIE